MAKRAPDPDYILRHDSCPISSISILSSTGEKLLLSGNQNGQVCIWNLKTRQITQTCKFHKNSILNIITNKNQIISHGRDNAVQIWQKNNDTWERTAYLACESSGFCKVSTISRHPQLTIAMPTDSSRVNIVSVETKEKLASFTPDEREEAYGMAMCLTVVNSASIVIGYEDGSVILWDIPSGKVLSHSKFYTDTVMCIASNNTVQRGVAGSVCNVLKVFSINEEGKRLESVSDISVANAGLNCVEFRNDGKIFASGGWDGNVRLFSTKKCLILAVLTFHSSSVLALCFDDDNSLAVGGKDGAISVWSMYK